MAGQTSAEKAAETPTESPRAAASKTPPPVVLDLGRQRRKRIKQLRRGAGRLMDEINGSIEELRTAGTIAPNAQPVVVVVRQKRRSAKGVLSPLF